MVTTGELTSQSTTGSSCALGTPEAQFVAVMLRAAGSSELGATVRVWCATPSAQPQCRTATGAVGLRHMVAVD